MGVEKQMGNNRVSQINDNFLKIGRVWAGAFVFVTLSFLLSLSPLPLSPFGRGWRLQKKRKGEKRQDNRLDPSA